DVVAALDDHSRHGRPHHCGPRRAQAHSHLHHRGDGGAQARRVRTDTHVPVPRRPGTRGEAMTGPKTNERPVLRRGRSHVNEELGTPGTRASARYVRMSAYKARQVLDLIRGHEAERAQEILQLCEREAATVVGKVLGSAMANAEHNDQVLPDELYVSA